MRERKENTECRPRRVPTPTKEKARAPKGAGQVGRKRELERAADVFDAESVKDFGPRGDRVVKICEARS